MDEKILAHLRQVEKQRNVRIVFACESGSRAAGYHAPDSDYDVRFWYVHPFPWYLSLEKQDDTITSWDRDTGLDVHGWELRKAFNLLRTGNANAVIQLKSWRVYVGEQFTLDLHSAPHHLFPIFGYFKAMHSMAKSMIMDGEYWDDKKILMFAWRVFVSDLDVRAKDRMPDLQGLINFYMDRERGAEWVKDLEDILNARMNPSDDYYPISDERRDNLVHQVSNIHHYQSVTNAAYNKQELIDFYEGVLLKEVMEK